MKNNNSQKTFQQLIVKNATLEFIGISVFILGVLGISDTGFPSLPVPKNDTLFSVMIVSGGVLVLWANYQIISLIIQQTKKR